MKMDFRNLEKISARGIFVTIGFGFMALLASGTKILPLLLLSPLFLLSLGLAKIGITHSGSVSDALIIFWWLFTYWWATKTPFWSVWIIYFLGIINLMISLANADDGYRHGGHPTNIFFFMENSWSPVLFYSLLGVMSIVYFVILYKVAKKGHKVYLAKWKAQDEQDLIEAAKFKTCPHCAETILAEAKVCKHCGRDI